MFQKRTLFVFTESWSRDQLMEKAYNNNNIFHLHTEVWDHDVGAEAEIQWLQGWTVQRNNWRTGGLL